MELRKTISRGSLWFAMTTLLLLGIGRCHKLASHDRHLLSIQVPSAQDSGWVWGDKSLPFRRQYNRKRWTRYRANTSTDGQGSIKKYVQGKEKNLSPQMAFALLQALRQGKEKLLAADSLRLGRQLEMSVRRMSDRQGSRPWAWNLADSAQWEAQPGIGPATAGKIIRYRDKLGGFIHPQQLLEIPKMDTLLVEFLSGSFQYDPKEIIKLNPNPNWKSLYKHPYVGAQVAKILHPFLSSHPLLTHHDWQNMQGINTETKSKITPYLDFID